MRYAVMAFVVAAVGCTKYGESPTGMVPVRGKVVTAGGTPVAWAQVFFYPTFPGAASGSGQTGADGAFVVKSLGDKDGLIPGSYKVTVAPMASKKSQATRVPEKYAEEHTSDLTAEVAESGGDVTIRLK